ncbi:MAG: type II toxin-antitoxin system VapC family toxin [Thermoguttaceae bacterium]|jgi:predicted nucleic acid-binding protein
MRYVLDASVAVSSVVSRPLTSKALRLRQDYQRGIHELIAPSVFSAEAASAVTKCERQKVIPVGQALPLLDDILSDLPQIHPYEPLLRRATAISSQTRAGLYDCLYVALAEREGCELVTADERLLNSLGRQFPFVIPLSSL